MHIQPPAFRIPRQPVNVLATGCALLFTSAGLASTTNNVIGTYTGWPTTWYALSALKDPVDSSLSSNPQLDFVGDTTNSGAYYASTNGYVFFRQRVHVATVVPSGGSATFHDAHFVLIDLVGQDYNLTSKTLQSGSDGLPDYGFAWDSKSNITASHGLEMSVRVQTNSVWSGNQMDESMV